MEYSNAVTALNTIKNGTYMTIVYSKDIGCDIIQRTEVTVRKGICYQNMSINEGRETGSLPWGHWVAGLENVMIEHKGKHYLRVSAVTPSKPNKNCHNHTTYCRHGVNLTREEVETYPIKKSHSSATPVYNVSLCNVETIKQEPRS